MKNSYSPRSGPTVEFTPGKLRLAVKGLLFFTVAFTIVSFGYDKATAIGEDIEYQDLVAGTGKTAAEGDIATIHLEGWLEDNGQKGVKFFDTRDQGRPIKFKIGTDKVMQAWNIGVVGMKAGGKRRLMVPSALGYGDRGIDGLVPPGSDLILEIELVRLE